MDLATTAAAATDFDTPSSSPYRSHSLTIGLMETKPLVGSQLLTEPDSILLSTFH